MPVAGRHAPGLAFVPPRGFATNGAVFVGSSRARYVRVPLLAARGFTCALDPVCVMSMFG